MNNQTTTKKIDIETLIEKLPHGSGFDSNWELLKTQKNGIHILETFFHNMNENGFYVGYTRLKLKISLEDMKNFVLVLPGTKNSWGKDFYEDTIYHSIVDLLEAV